MPPNLTIRNLTATALDLQHIERFAAEHVSRGASTLSNARGALISFLNATDFHTKELKPKGDPVSSSPALHRVEPFSTIETDVPAAEPGAEVVRLTFEADGSKYVADVPAPVGRSVTMRRVDDDGSGDDGRGGGGEFTTVYLPHVGFLAVFSSAHPGSWMSDLGDDLRLSVLSIPGTHNSPACYVALPSVRCQFAGIREQLDNGVRFLDVRVSAESGGDSMPLVHSAFPVSLAGTKYFSDLLAKCYAFLEENPGECVLMSVKREGTGRAGDRGMSRYLRDRYVASDPDRWFTGSHVPRLGEVRGRIVLVRRFRVDERVREEGGGGFGIDAEVWPDNCEDGTVGGGLVRIQDFYEIDIGRNVEKKIALSRAHLERAAALEHGATARGDGEALPLYFNFLSASNFFNATCWPERIAARVNPAIVEYLCTRHGVAGEGEKGREVGDGGTGVVITDWVGAHGDWDLIRCVVGMNSRLIVKGEGASPACAVEVDVEGEKGSEGS
ncbi:related to phosphatidylinositol phospholipase [Cephalotrichum gorgonifer]|uniref:Related to phosphatidylinositol phospholipase n=1 Tax=Cephalotrichum gorgonifer TaxID=2041049 RepID=A0AAE8SRI1_9PEZI|nr:related to phosphatidylinositol phospholipase [Cephalotrichum gorgonifer]